MTVAGPAANRSTQLNGLFSSLKLMTPLLMRSLRTLSPSRYRYRLVSSSQAWAQPPGNLLCRHFVRNVLSTVSRFHHATTQHSASVSRFVRRQVVAVLLDRPARDDADLAEVDRVVDLGPRQLLVAPLRLRATHGFSDQN